MGNNQKPAPHESQRPDLDLIRLEAESLANQIYFLQETLTGLAREGVSGKQLTPLAIRGLCSQLGTLGDRAAYINRRTCSLLCVGVDTVAEEWQ